MLLWSTPLPRSSSNSGFTPKARHTGRSETSRTVSVEHLRKIGIRRGRLRDDCGTPWERSPNGRAPARLAGGGRRRACRHRNLSGRRRRRDRDRPRGILPRSGPTGSRYGRSVRAKRPQGHHGAHPEDRRQEKTHSGRPFPHRRHELRERGEVAHLGEARQERRPRGRASNARQQHSTNCCDHTF